MTNLTIGTLFTNKKGDMFVVDTIETYTYKGETKERFTYYKIADSGLIHKHVSGKCKDADFKSKFTLLNWKF